MQQCRWRVSGLLKEAQGGRRVVCRGCSSAHLLHVFAPGTPGTSQVRQRSDNTTRPWIIACASCVASDSLHDTGTGFVVMRLFSVSLSLPFTAQGCC